MSGQASVLSEIVDFTIFLSFLQEHRCNNIESWEWM